jgi:hypothetical protein
MPGSRPCGNWKTELARELLTRHLQVSFPSYERIPDWVPDQRWIPTSDLERNMKKRLRTVAVVGAGASWPETKLGAKLATVLERDLGAGKESQRKAELDRLEVVFGLDRKAFETRLAALCSNPEDERRVRSTISKHYGLRHPTLLTYEVVAHLLKHRYIDAIISFNFDELLDQSLEDELGVNEFARVVSERDCPRLQLDPDQPDYRPLYIKLHGTASEPESLRFTRDSYYWIPETIKNTVGELLDTENLVLMNVGSRLSGFDFQYLLRTPRDMTIFHVDPHPLDAAVVTQIEAHRPKRTGGKRVDIRTCGKSTNIKTFLPDAVTELMTELKRQTMALGPTTTHWRPIRRHKVVAKLLDHDHPRHPTRYVEYLRQRTVLEVAFATAKGRGVLSSASLVNERGGRYYELYERAARAAGLQPASWQTVCAAGGLVEAEDAPDYYYARKAICVKGSLRREHGNLRTEHRLPQIDAQRMARHVLNEIDASRWPRRTCALNSRAQADLDLLARALKGLATKDELEIHSLDDRICSKVFVTPRVLATHTTFQRWTTAMIADDDFDELRIVAETGGWLAAKEQRKQFERLGEGKIQLLVAFDMRVKGLKKAYGDRLDYRLIPWWRHNRHMRVVYDHGVPLRGVYYARRLRTSLVTPVALRHGADLKRLGLSFEGLWAEADAYKRALKQAKKSKR